MEEKNKRTYTAPALEKGFEILELLAEKQDAMSLVQISAALNRSKNELYRMITTLESMGYLAKEEGSDYYRITNRLFDLGVRVPPVGTFIESAYPILKNLSAEIFQSSHIAVESQDRMVVVAKADTPASVGFTVHLGHHLYLHESGSGKVLLAWKSPNVLAQTFERLAEQAPEYNFVELTKELQQIRQAGFALTASPIIEGLIDISYPIYAGSSDDIVAVLTVPYLKNKAAKLDIEQAQQIIATAANKLSSLTVAYAGSL
ncbi:IclR family transcriptional regulator [Catenovulum sp. SX2]|uniref:IclR family transcriptional regulator n=1 Tax=Catenovulum sp. SX2 TaxID=3398614 RepID=UPI003F825F83